jgi:hypothetical protein
VCLKLNENSTSRKEEIQKSSTITVYKIVQVVPKGYKPPIFDSNPPYVLGEVYKYRLPIPCLKIDDPSIVSFGIHVCLSLDQFNLKKEYLSNCINKDGVFAILKCVAKTKDLIAVGQWDSHPECGEFAVFTQVKPIKEIRRFNVKAFFSAFPSNGEIL